MPGELAANSIQARVNRLDKVTAFSAILLKVFLSYYWIILRSTVPTYSVLQIDSEFNTLRIWPGSKIFSLRSNLKFFRDSLSRVICLNHRRFTKRGKLYASIRNELNSIKRDGYSIERFQDENAKELCEEIFSGLQSRNWNTSSRFPIDFKRFSLLVVIVRDSFSRPVTINAAWVMGEFAENFYYCSPFGAETRLLATESLVEFCFENGAKFFRTDNLLDLCTDTYNFQRKLHYETCNISWTNQNLKLRLTQMLSKLKRTD